MKATFLTELQTDGDTDLLGIATDLKDVLDAHFEYNVTSVKPWHRDALNNASGVAFAPPAAPGGVA